MRDGNYPASEYDTLRTFKTAIKKAYDDLSGTYPNINWKAGKLLNGMTKKELEEWVRDDASK